MSPVKKKAAKSATGPTRKTKRRVSAKSARDAANRWDLKLYIAGNTARSVAALDNLKAICEEHLKDRYRIEIIDLLQKPQLARGDQIFALPTLVRRLPTPIKKIIGDLSNTESVLVGLNIVLARTRR